VSHNLTAEAFGRGVFPDVPIEYELKNILEKQDLEMEMVRKIINSPLLNPLPRRGFRRGE
jgi:hypothetical protein